MDENSNGNGYTPSPRVEEILNYAMEKIQSIDYTPSGRWVFYQIYQKFGMKKGASKIFDRWTSRARKAFWNGWRPDIFSDSMRSATVRGRGDIGPIEALDDMRKTYFVFDKFLYQDNYVEIWYEAAAMHGQFRKVTRDWHVTLVPFRGDASIPYKYEIAERLDSVKGEYGIPIVILYFGDYDSKGFEIPISACKDIRAWSNADFEFIRCGINDEQIDTLEIPENPDKPGTYQWEALDEDQAENMILDNLSKYIDLDRVQSVIRKEEKLENLWKDKIDNVIDEMIQASEE